MVGGGEREVAEGREVRARALEEVVARALPAVGLFFRRVLGDGAQLARRDADAPQWHVCLRAVRRFAAVDLRFGRLGVSECQRMDERTYRKKG